MTNDKNTIVLFFPLADQGETFTNIPWVYLRLERVIRDLNLNLIFIDERIESNYSDILIQHKDKILFAGVSSMIGYQIACGVKFIKIFKTICDAPVIWGGWFPTIYPEIILADGYVDAVCVGQGEEPFRAFSERLLSGTSYYDIPGIGYVNNGKIIINDNAKLVNPDSFPPVNMDLIDFNKYIDLNGIVPIERRTIDYLATTGCTYSCGFCSVTTIFGKKWYTRKVSDIIKDFKYFVEKANVSYISSWDENFFANKKFVIDFCNELNKSGLKLTWCGCAHVGYFLKHFTDNDIKFLYKSGCREIRLGCESGDQEVLDLVNKKIKVEDNLKLVKLLTRNKMPARLFFMACLPKNPDRDFWKTINFMGKVYLINPNFDLKIRFYSPIAKTELYNLSIENGFRPAETMTELVNYFGKDFTFHYAAPWTKKDYHKIMNYYVSFYFLFTDPFYYKKFKTKKRMQMFLLNVIMFPIVWLRFKFNFNKFPFEVWLFKKTVDNCRKWETKIK